MSLQFSQQHESQQTRELFNCCFRIIQKSEYDCCVCGTVSTWEEAGVASVWVLFAETEGAVVALWDAASTLVKKFDQPPPAPEIHPELVEEGAVSEVMLVGDCRQEKWTWREWISVEKRWGRTHNQHHMYMPWGIFADIFQRWGKTKHESQETNHWEWNHETLYVKDSAQKKKWLRLNGAQPNLNRAKLNRDVLNKHKLTSESIDLTHISWAHQDQT